LPFDQDLKRKTVVRADGADAQMCRVYVKGAPEEIIPICTQTLDTDV
jgi:magnesium-transporting ATPase (P-type)